SHLSLFFPPKSSFFFSHSISFSPNLKPPASETHPHNLHLQWVSKPEILLPSTPLISSSPLLMILLGLRRFW
ncbi:hypothetical protein GIB67_012047, partial [Kingdonia uniflora]